MLKKIIVGNWKMNPLTLKEAEKLFSGVAKGISGIKKTEVVICPPLLYLEKLKKISRKIILGAQNTFLGDVGAFTGEISSEMLYDIGVKYVILGHSERRAMGENNSDINKKIKSSLVAGLRPVLCVGESVRDENHGYFNLVKMELEECLAGIPKNSISKIIIAYEPIWAISSTPNRKDATSDDSREMSIFIRKVLSDKFGEETAKVRIIYGGSVTEKDAGDFLKNGGVDGLLPGRASLDAKKVFRDCKNMRSVKQIKNLKGKTVLLRVDFNVPIKNGKVEDDFRIRASLPTINFLLKKEAKIILITHLGKDGVANLTPVIKSFFAISKIAKDKVTFFDNVRKFPGEAKNDQVFAKKLGAMGDIYVNDAFSVCHREHASVVSIPKYLPSYAGLELEEEVKNLSHSFNKIKHPFLFILGGAKFSTKMPLIKKYLKLVDHIFIGGALADDFLKVEGYEIGKSLVDDTNYDIKKIIKDKKLILPSDVIVHSGNKLITKKINQIGRNEIIFDIGEESVKNLASLIKKSKLILWNGPLGKYEDGGAGATKKILKLVANSKAESIIGGGDTVTLISKMKMQKKFSFVSTGGGATLDFLANGTLPGIKALR